MAGRIPSIRPLDGLKLLLALLLIAVSFAITSQPALGDDDEESCVFPFTPTTYEDLHDRKLFLDTIDLASFNMLFPGDPYFGLPDIEVGPRDARVTQPGQVPPVLLKSIAYIESSITQGGAETPFGSIGPALIAFDCGHGVAQVTTGMTVPAGEDGRGSPQQALVATHFAYNIARGAHVLIDKWNEAPEEKPIAGIDTGGHPALLENWYFAIWSYNGFTGPGANRSNHPMDPIYGSWPRMPYSCGPDDDGLGHNRSAYPYQELVLGCAAHPPEIDGDPLWQAQPVSLPDLNNESVKDALDLDNFVFPYANMDITTAQPFHMDSTEAPNPKLRAKVLGDPKLAASSESVDLGFTPDSGSTTQIVDVFNTGTGVMAWYAIPSADWLTIRPYTGVAVGSDIECEEDVPCDRAGHMELTVDPSAVPPGVTNAQVVLQALGTGQQKVINVRVSQVIRLGVPGITSN